MTQDRESSRFAPVPSRTASARASSQRWIEATGAHVLVVDPVVDERFRLDMASRGVHVTSVASTVDGLVEFGRTAPYAILIAPSTPGIPPCQFIKKVREYASPVIIALRDAGDMSSAGELLLAGATAAVTRPYSAAGLWELLEGAAAPINHARVSFGPIELDALAYTVRIHGERIADLPLKEFELLSALMLRAPEILNKEDLRTALWGSSGTGKPSDNTIATHVGRLRNRLHGVAEIRRIYGRGYSLTLK